MRLKIGLGMSTSRNWLRISSIAFALVLLLLAFSSIQYLPQGRLLVESWKNEQATQSKHEGPSASEAEAPDESGRTAETTILLDIPQSSSDLSMTATSSSAVSTSTGYSKIVVLGRTQSENTSWIQEELPDWQSAIYYVDLDSDETSPSGLKTNVNKGKEGNPYLKYIVDHYPNFPDVIAFIHAHRGGFPLAWHTDQKDNDGVIMLRDLQLGYVVREGYANMRCESYPGCPNEVRPWRDPPIEDKLPERLYPYVYSDLFQVPFYELRDELDSVGVACCAQFAVSREQILKRPKGDYERYLHYLEASTFEDDVIGRVYEYMWHIMFGRDITHCPAQKTCQCEVFGHCNSGSSSWPWSKHGAA
ncbi:hypothetical protein D0869_11881 [Hortaea werneckii]|nr:hypothetical protein D0869_11881 [Hortaea werneckii]RMX92903.1 hypothetical protein D0867_14400 [Hortaea werneckii]